MTCWVCMFEMTDTKTWELFTKGVNVIGNFRKVCDPIKENVKASRKGAVVQFFGSSGFCFLG